MSELFKIIPFSLVDSPDQSAMVVFNTDYCPLQCSYCYNSHLWKKPEDNSFSIAEVKREIKQNVNKNMHGQWFSHNAWIIFSGSEPFLTDLNILDDFIKTTKALPYPLKIGIWTNGCCMDEEKFNQLKLWINTQQVNWLNIDYKFPFDLYNLVNVSDTSYLHDLLQFVFESPKYVYEIQLTTVVLNEHIQYWLPKMIPTIIAMNMYNKKVVWRLVKCRTSNTLSPLLNQGNVPNKKDIALFVDTVTPYEWLKFVVV